MNKMVHIGTPSAKERKRSCLAWLPITLTLIVYCLLIEQYGFPFLELDGDEQVAVEAPS